MSPKVIRRLLISFVLAIAGLGSALAQTTITVNGANCPGATVTHSLNTIAISTTSCTAPVLMAPTITSGAPPATGSVGVAYSHTLTASGSTPITWTVTSGALPTGLALSGATISGTPTVAGVFAFAVTASNGTLPNAVAPTSGTFPLTINVVPPVISSATLPTATPGQNYSYTLAASQPIPNGGWSVVTPGTQPPAWISLPALANGTLSGIPGTGDLGTTAFSVIATNSNGPSAAQAVSLTVSPPTAPAITSSAPAATGTVGTPYSFAFAATGTAPITWSVTGGTQPAGLTLNSSSGVLSGTPTTAGTYTFAVQATNGTLPNAVAPTSGTFTVTISAAQIGGVSKDINNVDIPVPSKRAGIRPDPHVAPNGAGALYAWGVNPARCNNTLPAITSSWHHNIDFTNHRWQGQIDFFDMAANEALTYEFTPTSVDIGDGVFLIGTTSQLPLPANFVSISTRPCDFDLTKLVSGAGRDYCFSTAPVDNAVYYAVTNGSAPSTCKLAPGTKYYFNIRWQYAAPGSISNTADSCAAIGYPRCGAYVQIR